eukprot:8512950-Lingulodinium_polyedra.AAC.1
MGPAEGTLAGSAGEAEEERPSGSAASWQPSGGLSDSACCPIQQRQAFAHSLHSPSGYSAAV